MTNATLVRFFSRVRPHVEHQRRSGAEDLPADRAERAFDSALVLPHIMRPHVSLSLKGSVAEGAGELPLVRVDARSVLLPAVVAGKRLAADVAPIGFTRQALMDVSAVIHVLLAGNKLLVTLLACYYIGRLTCLAFIYLLYFKRFI